METFELIGKIEVTRRENGELAIRLPLHHAEPEGSRVTLELSPRDRQVIEELSDGDTEEFQKIISFTANILGAAATMRQWHLVVYLFHQYTGALMHHVLEDGMRGLANQIKWMIWLAGQEQEINFLELYRRFPELKQEHSASEEE